MIVLIQTKGADSKKITDRPREANGDAGFQSSLILLLTPEKTLLTWLMERDLSENVLSLLSKATAIMAKKKPDRNSEMIFLIRKRCIAAIIVIFTLLISEWGVLYHLFLVEAAGVEPASENIPLQFLRTYPLI